LYPRLRKLHYFHLRWDSFPVGKTLIPIAIGRPVPINRDWNTSPLHGALRPLNLSGPNVR
jgi:hypothetical protein